MKVFGNLDLQVNQILRQRLEQLASDPITDLVSGRVWYNTTENVIKYYDGTQIKTLADNITIQNLNQIISDLQAELDTTQSGAGLGVDGSYTADATTNYITGATSLFNADKLLDIQLKTVADGLAQEVADRTNADASIQSELDATQTGAGLGVDGSYTADATTNYISAATSLFDADKKLDAKIKEISDNVLAVDLQTAYNQSSQDVSGAAGITLTTGKDFRIYDDTDSTVYFQIDSETGAVTITGDLFVNGTTTTVNSTINDADHWLISPISGTTSAIVINPDTGVTFTTDVVDVKITNNGDSVFKINAAGTVEINNGSLKDKFIVNDQTITNQSIPTSGTVNLGHTYISSGTFTLNGTVGGVAAVEGTDYTLDYKTGILTIINILDAGPTVSYTYHPTFDGRNLSLDGATLDAHVDNLVVTTKHTGEMISYDNSVSGLTAINVQSAIDELKTNIGSSNNDLSNLQAELDATQTGAGLGANGSYTADATTNYISAATSLFDADKKLDAQIKVNADGLAQEITDRQIADTAIRDDFGSVASGKGASLVGVSGSFTNASGTNVQSILAGFDVAISNAGKRYLAQNVTLTYNGTTQLYEATLTHNIGEKYVTVSVYENDEIIIPQSIVAVDQNTTKVSFTSNIIPTIKIVA